MISFCHIILACIHIFWATELYTFIVYATDIYQGQYRSDENVFIYVVLKSNKMRPFWFCLLACYVD